MIVGTSVPIQKFRQARADVAASGREVIIACPQGHVEWLRDLLRREGAPGPVYGFSTEESLKALLHQLANTSEVAAIVPLSERVVVSVANACERLALRGPGPGAARLSRRKDLQRERLTRWRLPYARTTAGLPLDVWPTRAEYPVIVKPIDASGSTGIKLARDAADLRQALNTLSGTVIVETFIDGPEFSVEAIVSDGTPVWMGVARKETNAEFVEVGQLVGRGAATLAQEQALMTAARQLIEDAEIRDSFLHAEFLLPAGQPQALVEFACRPPGDALMLLHSMVSGQDLGTRWIAELAGTTYQAPAINHTRSSAAGQKYLIHGEGGEYVGIHSDARTPVVHLAEGELWPTLDSLDPAAGAVCLSHQPRGSLIGEVSSSFTRAASVVTTAPSARQAQLRLQALATSLRPVVRPLP